MFIYLLNWWSVHAFIPVFFSRVEKALRWFDGCMLVLSSFDTTNGDSEKAPVSLAKNHEYRAFVVSVCVFGHLHV